MCCLDVTLMLLFLIGSHGEQSSAAVVTLERVQDFETLIYILIKHLWKLNISEYIPLLYFSKFSEGIK